MQTLNIHYITAAGLKVAVLQSAMVPVYTAVASIGVAVTIIMGGQEVIRGSWLIGTFWSFLTTFTAMAARAPKAAKVFNMWHAADAAWERITEELNHHASVPPQSTPPSASAAIEVKNLSFRYPLGTSDAITNITFRARPDVHRLLHNLFLTTDMEVKIIHKYNSVDTLQRTYLLFSHPRQYLVRYTADRAVRHAQAIYFTDMYLSVVAGHAFCV